MRVISEVADGRRTEEEFRIAMWKVGEGWMFTNNPLEVDDSAIGFPEGVIVGIILEDKDVQDKIEIEKKRVSDNG